MVRKDKISVTLNPTIVGELDDRVGEKYDSRSEAVEDLLTTAFSADERESKYEDRISKLEQENERLHRERRQLLEQREENTELVRYAREQRSIEREREERRRERESANILRKTWWALAGRPTVTETDSD